MSPTQKRLLLLAATPGAYLSRSYHTVWELDGPEVAYEDAGRVNHGTAASLERHGFLCPVSRRGPWVRYEVTDAGRAVAEQIAAEAAGQQRLPEVTRG